MRIRRYRPADAAGCARVFHAAVQVGAASAYRQAQRDAWSANVPPAADWARRMRGLISWVADDGDVAGFIAVRSDGYVDLVFVRPDRIGQGVGTALYDTMEAHCRKTALSTLTTAASHLAKPFFLRQGWVVDRVNTVERNGVALDNWLMHKNLQGLNA